MKAVLTKVRSLGVFGIAILASCGSSDHFGVAPGGGERSSGAGGSSAGEGDSGAVFQSPGGSGGSGGAGQFAPAQGSVLTPQSIDQCTTGAPSGLGAASLKALLAGGSAGSLRYLYPYAQTVFPRGLGSPTLMWDGGNADYVYVHIKSSLFEYKGCLAPTKAGQVLIPQDVWAAAGVHARGASDPFAVSLTLISGSTVTGPITESIVIAPATLKGSVYYNTYSTKLLSATSGGSGAVLRIEPGQTASVFLGQSGCTGCHAVSANGTRMVAAPVGGGGTYVLTANATPNPTPLVSNATDASFVGLSPDGKLYIGSAHPGGTGGPRSGSATNITNAALYETDTGNTVSGSGIPTGAMMPTFSPDGTLIAFTDSAINNGQGLATMTFDNAGRKASGYKKIFQASGSGSYPGWPFFLPDNKAVVFSAGSATDYSGSGVGLSFGGVVSVGLSGAPASDLFVVDVATGTSTILAQAMGFASPADVTSNKTYLPFGASEELHHNYDPTVSPVAAGGYFWVFFDSYRHYGNEGLQRQLWGAAIDVSADGKYVTDASHPAFYLTGQELGTGNHRAFTALDPCRADGASCTSGVDCCDGFCSNGTCGVKIPRCSNVDEACGPGHMCCDPTVQCINGFCAAPIAK
jgi:Tol biopolymer transport system component